MRRNVMLDELRRIGKEVVIAWALFWKD